MSADHDRIARATSREGDSDQPSINIPLGHNRSRPTNIRYRVLMLTFLVAFVMYMDRTCIGVATPTLMREFGINKIQMGWAASAFNAGYTLFQVPAGWMADRYGPRIILGVALAWWSVFTGATGLAYGLISFSLTRFLFGVGEAAAFPAASRAILPWLPATRCAFGQGFQHAGSRLGAAATPPIFVFLITHYGWRPAFFTLGIIGIVLAAVWVFYFRNTPEQHSQVNTEELTILRSAGQQSASANQKISVPWRHILGSRDLWFLSSMYFCYGWVLWLYLNWIPTYLVEVRSFTQMEMGLAASVPLLAAALTNIGGGTLSDRLVHGWGNLRRGRVVVSVCGFAVAAIGLLIAANAATAGGVLLFLTVALAGLELTVAGSWAMALDLGGIHSGSVSAVMNTLGNLGGTLSGICIGYLSTLYGWTWVFGIASAICLLAALLATQIDPTRSITGGQLPPRVDKDAIH
ncbi:MAG: MFS transporter [Chloroflexia bacterium]